MLNPEPDRVLSGWILQFFGLWYYYLMVVVFTKGYNSYQHKIIT